MASNNYKYNFVPNKRAMRNTLDEQIQKIAEEHKEVEAARYDLDDTETLDELMDLMYAAEGCLRKFSKRQVDDAYRRCIQKAIDRDDIA